MPWTFDGIDKKLERADENVRNLNREIAGFFKESKYPTLPKNDDELLLEALEYHKKRPVPLRFSVLTGEVIHHFRSCLDHIVWEFSTEEYRRKSFRKIEFPVFENEPVDKDTISRYEGKIKGITKPAIRDLIRDLQPYKAPHPIDSPLLIIHKMDIFDKHRELVLVASNVEVQVPLDLAIRLRDYQGKDPDVVPADLTAEVKSRYKPVLQVSFRQFGRRTIQPVVPGLVQLSNEIRHVAARFEALA